MKYNEFNSEKLPKQCGLRKASQIKSGIKPEEEPYLSFKESVKIKNIKLKIASKKGCSVDDVTYEEINSYLKAQIHFDRKRKDRRKAKRANKYSEDIEEKLEEDVDEKNQ